MPLWPHLTATCRTDLLYIFLDIQDGAGPLFNLHRPHSLDHAASGVVRSGADHVVRVRVGTLVVEVHRAQAAIGSVVPVATTFREPLQGLPL